MPVFLQGPSRSNQTTEALGGPQAPLAISLPSARTHAVKHQEAVEKIVLGEEGGGGTTTGCVVSGLESLARSTEVVLILMLMLRLIQAATCC